MSNLKQLLKIQNLNLKLDRSDQLVMVVTFNNLKITAYNNQMERTPIFLPPPEGKFKLKDLQPTQGLPGI